MVDSKVLDVTTQKRLENWARWSRDMSWQHRLNYPRQSMLTRWQSRNRVMDEPQNPNSPPPIDELDAEKIENAVYLLARSYILLARCLRARWIHEFSGRRLATELDTNHVSIWTLVSQAEMALQGVLLNK